MNHTIQGSPSVHWWDEKKYPTIAVGPVAFPALILPFLTAFVFVFCKTYPRRPLPANNQAHGPLRPDERAQRHGRNNADNLPADAPDLERYAGHALGFFHQISMQSALYGSSIHSHHSDKNISSRFCYLQAVALLIGGTAFGQPSGLMPCLATAFGWLCFGLALPTSLTNEYLVAIAILALPCTLRRPGNIRRGESLSANVLLTLACDALLPTTSSLRAPKLFSSLETWRFLPVIGTSLASWLIETVKNFLRPPPAPIADGAAPLHSIAEAILNALSTYSQEFLLTFAKLFALFGPLTLGTVISAFNISCLPWKRILTGGPSSPPAATPVALFMVANPFVGIHALWWRRQQQRRRVVGSLPLPALLRRAILNSVEAMGWLVSGFVCLWVLLSYL